MHGLHKHTVKQLHPLQATLHPAGDFWLLKVFLRHGVFCSLVPGYVPAPAMGQFRSKPEILLVQVYMDLCRQIRPGKWLWILCLLCPPHPVPPPPALMPDLQIPNNHGHQQGDSGLPTGLSAPCALTKHFMALLQ